MDLGLCVRIERVGLRSGEPDVRLGMDQGEVDNKDHGGGLEEGDSLVVGLHGWRIKVQLSEEERAMGVLWPGAHIHALLVECPERLGAYPPMDRRGGTRS